VGGAGSRGAKCLGKNHQGRFALKIGPKDDGGGKRAEIYLRLQKVSRRGKADQKGFNACGLGCIAEAPFTKNENTREMTTKKSHLNHGEGQGGRK